MVSSLSLMGGLFMTIRARRFAAAGALAVAAVAAPLAIALTEAAPQASTAQGRAWPGTATRTTASASCYSNGSGQSMGTPFGVYGPNTGAGVGINGGGLISGPLLPGQTYTNGVGTN